MIAIRWAAEALATSWTFDVVGGMYLERVRASGTPIIYTIWHGKLLPALWWHRNESTTVLASDHRDGGLLADTITRWGYRVVRGSSTRGGAPGLRSMVEALRRGANVALTPDGPRGPDRVAKPGAVAAAQHSGAYIVPVGASASSAWRTRSWDRMLIPRPLTTVRIVYEEPFQVGAGREAFAEGVERLQASLTSASDRAECRA